MALTKTEIKKTLREQGYNPIDLDAKAIYVALDYKDRMVEMNKISAIFVLDRSKIITKRNYTSDGHVMVNSVSIIVVPKQKIVDMRRLQRHLSSVSQNSLKNEVFLEKGISQIMWDTMQPLTVVFHAMGKKITIKNVTGTTRVGGDVSNRKKADIIIKTKSFKIPVSIKQDNAGFWESADTYWGKNAKKMLVTAAIQEKLDADINGDQMRLKKPVGTIAKRMEERDVIFGSDVVKGGLIVKRTFKDKDFSYDGKNHILTIKCSRIYTRQSDLKPEDKAWFVVRNNKNARSRNIGINGVVIDAVPKKSVTGTTQVIDRSVIK